MTKNLPGAINKNDKKAMIPVKFIIDTDVPAQSEKSYQSIVNSISDHANSNRKSSKKSGGPDNVQSDGLFGLGTILKLPDTLDLVFGKKDTRAFTKVGKSTMDNLPEAKFSKKEPERMDTIIKPKFGKMSKKKFGTFSRIWK